MNRDDIIQMAREAGFEFNSLGGTHTSGKLDEHLERFAALVAAAEREACARVCEAQQVGQPSYFEIDERIGECAAAIRARGNT